MNAGSRRAADWIRSASLLLLAASVSLAAVASPQSTAGDPPAPTPAEGVQESFDILEYRVLGNSRLDPRDIEAAVYPHLGPGKSIDSAQEARAALERAYRDRGFGTVFVDIPEQEVADGVVRLRVTEGRLDRVRVSGARYFSNQHIRAAVPALERGTVPDLQAVQRELAELNRQTTDRAVTPILRAGRTPGTVDVELRVQDELPVHASLEVTDRYSADTSHTRANLNLSYDNLFQRRHRLSLQYQTAPERPSEARVLAATYLAPVGDAGRLLAVYAVDTDSDVTTLGALSVLGRGRIYGARFIAPIPETSRLFHSFSFGPDFKDFTDNVRLAADQNLQTPIQYLGWSLGYSGTWLGDASRTSFGLTASLGIRGFGNEPREFEDKRFRGAPNYSYLRGEASHERGLLLGTTLFSRVAGQFTASPLVSNEQFSIGGAESVRGYLESEELGDYGVSGTLELRSPSFAGSLLLAFVDAGLVDILEPLPQQPTRRDLSSYGVGLRFQALNGFEGSLDWAYPLVPASRTMDGDSRIHFQVKYGF